MYKAFSLNRMIVFITTIGFAVVLLDTTIEHWELLNEELWVYIPVLYCILAISIGIIAVLKWKSKIIRLFQIVLFISFIVSATGLYFHLVEEDDEDVVELTVEQKDKEEKEKDKPLIAPFAFSGLAVFGLLGTSKKWKAEVWEDKV